MEVSKAEIRDESAVRNGVRVFIKKRTLLGEERGGND